MSERDETQEWTMSADPISGEVVAIRVATPDEIEEWELTQADDTVDADESSEWELV